MATHVRQRSRRYGLTLLVCAVLLAALLLAVRPNGGALATSGDTPYNVPFVTDTNPDPNIVETTLIAEEATVNIGGGVTAHAQTFNGTIPGPTFQLKVGDTVIVHFENHLDRETGIHWHGIELSNNMDGTPFTQNQVQPGGKFLYKFKVSRPGIFWYHPHHHASTNQVFKGLYGMILITDPNEAALRTSGTLPSAADTLPMVLSDTTVCKAPGSNDATTFDTTLPWVGPLDALPAPQTGNETGVLPAQAGPHPVDLCETGAIDVDGNPLAGGFQAGDIPNNQTLAANGRTNEGQTVLTNGMNVGGRAGKPPAPGALAAGASTYPVKAGQGLRLEMVNSATTRFFRLRLTDNAGTQIPLVRVGGEGGLLDNAVVEGGVVVAGPNTFDTKYKSGEILLDPGSRADVVIAVPAAAVGTLTLWTEDYDRTGQHFSNVPTVPVAHFSVSGSVSPYTISAGTALRTATGDTVPVLSGPINPLLDQTTFSPPKVGFVPNAQNPPNNPDRQNIRLTQTGGPGGLGINDVFGTHDIHVDYTVADHLQSTRYAKVGDTLELTVENTTGGAHHPYHLHGFSMQPISLIKTGGPAGHDYIWPYHEFRDNIDVPPGYTLKFRTQLVDRALADGVTPGGRRLGRWLFHCHIFFHATNGMLGEVVVVAANGNEKPDVNANGVQVNGHHLETETMHGTYHDIDGDAVALSASVGSVTDDGGGNWTWTHTTNGTELSRFIYVTATDAGGKKDEAVFFLNILNTPPTLHLPGAQTQDYHDVLSFPVTATDPDALDTVSLSASGLPAGLTFTDHGDRTGTVTGTITVAPGVYVATFSADDHHAPPVTGTVTITVTREETTATYTGPTVILQGSPMTLTATLLEDGTTPTVPPEPVTLSIGAQSCVDTTDVTGTASCTLAYTGPLGGSILVSASFAGDTFYLPSSDAKTAVVFAFPSRGAFVLGNTTVATAGPTTKVTWWGSSWAKLNDLTGGDAPSSFKGFAAVITLPTSTPPAICGSAWTTSGGNSPSPPSAVPSYMGVVVASTVTKSGSTISGNSVHIVVVKVNPGYGPDPGDAGTGTIVATYC